MSPAERGKRYILAFPATRKAKSQPYLDKEFITDGAFELVARCLVEFRLSTLGGICQLLTLPLRVLLFQLGNLGFVFLKINTRVDRVETFQIWTTLIQWAKLIRWKITLFISLPPSPRPSSAAQTLWTWRLPGRQRLSVLPLLHVVSSIIHQVWSIT